MKEDKSDETPEGMVKYKELKTKYDATINNEATEMESFVYKLQEYVFDYFNLITKEYYLSLDLHSEDQEYVKTIKKQQEEIDEQIKEEDLLEPLPEGLNKEMANQLLSEKEAVMQRVFMQIQNVRQNGQNYDLEKTISLNEKMFGDRMYLKTKYTGKDLQRAVHKLGIYKEKME